MKHIWKILIILILAATSCNQNDAFDTTGLRQQTIDTLSVLNSNDHLPGPRGIAGEPSSHTETTKWFSKHINNKEAYILYEHPNSFIKALAIKQFYSGRDPLLYNIVVDTYSDTLKVYKAAGCMVISVTLFEYCLAAIHYPYSFLDDTTRWTNNQMHYIDSLAMTTSYQKEFKRIKQVIEKNRKNKQQELTPPTGTGDNFGWF